MGGLSAQAISTLEPFVGPMAASTCVRATALALGKTADDLGPADLPALNDSIRRLLGPVAPAGVINQILADIEVASNTEMEVR